jgi:hypothetical protein
VSELVGSVCLGVADLITDAITYARLRSGDVAVPNEGYKAAYAAVLSVGAVTTVLSLLYRLRNAHIMRAHLRKLGRQGRTENTGVARRQAQQHEWELAQTHRTRVISMLALLSVATQGLLPLHPAQNARVSRGAPTRQDRGQDSGAVAFAGLPMSIINCCIVFISDKPADAMVRTLSWSATCRKAPRGSALRFGDTFSGARFVARLGAPSGHQVDRCE